MREMAWYYYSDPKSPTYRNAYKSLVRVGYSPAYAKSSGTKVFGLPRQEEIIFFKVLPKILLQTARDSKRFVEGKKEENRSKIDRGMLELADETIARFGKKKKGSG